MAIDKHPISYPELGGVDQQTKFYDEGAEIVHPSGIIYVRRNGSWVIKHSEKDRIIDEQAGK